MPPAVWEHWVSRFIAAHNDHDTTAAAALLTDDVTIVNHRQIATWDVLHGPHAWLEVQEALWASSPDTRYSHEHVEGDDIVGISRWRVDGHMEPGGGEWAFAFLGVGRRRVDRVDRIEAFDEDDEAGARACAERLRAEAADEGATVRLIRRYTDAVNEHDWVAAEACLTDDLEAFDHRVASPLGRERDRATYHAQIRALADQAGDFRLDYELVADLDEVGAIRGAWRGHLNDGGGEFETPMVIVGRRRGDQWDRFDVFDPEDDAGWAACIAQLLADRGAALAMGVRWMEHQRARDWDSLFALYSPDAVLLDRRQVGAGEMRGPARIVEFARGIVELVPDGRNHAVRVLENAPHLCLARVDLRGHDADGGEIEVPYLLLMSVLDGRLASGELFDPGDEEVARRRFRELAGEAELSPNERLVRRLVQALNAREWDAAEACLTEDVSMVNHVPLSAAPVERDWPSWREQFQALVESAGDARGAFEVVADVDAALVMRYCLRGHLNDGGGEFEAPVVIVGRRRGDRFDHFEQFEPDDDVASSARFAELLGERGAALAVGARWWGHQRARDWHALRALLSDDATFVDRRQVGAGEMRGPAFVEFSRGLVELVPDARIQLVRLLEARAELFLSRFDLRGHAADGGEIEVPYISLARVRNGLIDYAELFDPGDEQEARRRFEELARASELSPNERLGRRLVEAVNARDWDAAEACLTEDVVFVNHRALSPPALERDWPTWRAEFQGLLDATADGRGELEMLADVGELAAFRFRWSGHLNEGGGEFEIAMTGVARRRGDRFDRVEGFDPDDDAAWGARFPELLGERGAALTLGARWTERFHARDWDALSALLSHNATVVDRRQLGAGEVRGATRLVEFARGLVELVPDARLHVVRLLDALPQLTLTRFDIRGHAADGGEIEVPHLSLIRVHDRLIDYAELFDAADEEGARRRFAELSRADAPVEFRERVDRFVAAYNERDWDSVREAYAPDVRVVDRRLVSLGEFVGAALLVDHLRGGPDLAADVSVDIEPLAVGRSAWVLRTLFRGHFEAGGGEVELVTVNLNLSEHDLTTYLELFDGADVASALARFEEIGAQTEHERLYARACRLINEQDWDALADCYTEDFELIDHRVLGWKPIRGPEGLVQYFRSWAGIGTEGDCWFEALAGDDEHLAARAGVRGLAAEVGGGPAECVLIAVTTIRDGRFARTELLGADEEDAALARLVELTDG